MVRYIGMDVHREIAQLAVVEDGLGHDEGRIEVTPEALRAWAVDLPAGDAVALGAGKQRRDRDAADATEGAGSGVEPVQDPGEDRQG